MSKDGVSFRAHRLIVDPSMKLHALVPSGGGVHNKWVKLQLIVMMWRYSVKPLKEQLLGRTEAFEARVVDARGIRL